MDLTSLLRTISKAIAGTVAGFVVAWLMKQNIVIPDSFPDFLEQLIAAAIVGAVVFFAPKNKESKS